MSKAGFLALDTGAGYDLSLRISRRYHALSRPEGREAMLYSDRKGVRWDDLDMTANPTALREMRPLSGQTERPVIVIDGKVIVGCEPAVLEPLVPSQF